MTARVTAAVLFTGLGLAAAVAVGTAPADPPMGSPPTVYVTLHDTKTVHDRYQGWTARTWAAHAIHNRRLVNHQRITLRRIRRHLQARWRPTVDYGLHLASAVFGVSYSKMRAVAYCESTLNPFATNGRYQGVFQLGWSPFGFSPFDPVASALSTAQTVVHDGGWRQWECG